MDSHDTALHLARLVVPSPRRLSPLARGVGYRLAWAGGLAAALWLAVFWALAR